MGAMSNTIDLPIKLKQCPKCKQIKSSSSFGASSNRPDGLQIQCKACRSAYYHAHKLPRVTSAPQPDRIANPVVPAIDSGFISVGGHTINRSQIVMIDTSGPSRTEVLLNGYQYNHDLKVITSVVLVFDGVDSEAFRRQIGVGNVAAIGELQEENEQLRRERDAIKTLYQELRHEVDSFATRLKGNGVKA